MRPIACHFAIVAVILLAACQMQAPKTDAPPVAARDLQRGDVTPLTPEAITVTTLGSTPAAALNPTPLLALKPAAAGALAVPAVVVQVPTKTTPRPMPRPARLTPDAPKTPALKTPAPKTPAPKTPATETSVPVTPPPPPVPPEQALCEKSGGQWSSVDATSGHVCVHRTRDSAKACHRKTDCQGECLATSGTCAPITPLMGCNDILQANGVRMTLCLQ